MSKGSFKTLIKEAKKQDSYWTEQVILEFTSDLFRLMQAKGTTKSELANILGTSQAYITKVFGGNANFTIQSMVKLTRAIGGKLHIHVADRKTRVYWMGSIDGGKVEDELVWNPKTIENKGVKRYETITATAD